MTIASPNQRNDYTGNNSTPTYAFTFEIFDPTHLNIYQVDTSGNVTPLALNTDYTVSATNPQYPSPGTITLTAGNLPLNYQLSILGAAPVVQDTSIRNEGDFLPEVHEAVFDYLTTVDQQQQNKIDSSLKLPPTINPSNFCMNLPQGISCAPGSMPIVNPTCNGWTVGPNANQIACAQAYACIACNCAASAAASATTASNCATTAAACATTAAACASAASTSAASASTSASSASTSATNAATSATTASNCASAASTSASNAASSASSASGSASSASTSATTASNCATLASSCTATAVSCTATAVSCTATAVSCTATAVGCAASASTSATNAATSATNAASSATTASNCATTAAACATTAAACALFAKNCVSVLGPFGGDTGAGGTQGLVPAPPAGSTAANMFLSACGGFVTPPTGKVLTRCVITSDQIFTSPSNICWLTAKTFPLNFNQIPIAYDGVTTPTFAAISSNCCLYTWGSGQCGVDGQAGILPTCVPTVVNSTCQFKMASMGELSAAAIDFGGNIQTWGSNASGQLGNGGITAGCSPACMTSTNKWYMVSMGVQQAAAIDCNRCAWAWGSGANGGTGLSCSNNTCTPQPVCCVPKVQFIRASNNNMAIIDIGGCLWTVGRGNAGVLGNGTSTSTAICQPQPTCCSALGWRMVSMSEAMASAVTCGGDAYSWGCGQCGGLMLGSTTSQCIPQLVDGTKKWITFVPGQFQSAGIDVCGNLWTAGANMCGSLGIGSITPACTAQHVCPGTKFKSVSVFSCAMMATTVEGVTLTWGASSCGMGNGTVTASCTPVIASGGITWGILYQQASKTFYVQPSINYCVSLSGQFPAFGADPIVQDYSTNYMILEYFT